jgi:hypothetical protein
MRPDVRRQEIEESAHPRRQMPALPDIDGVQRFLVAGVEIPSTGTSAPALMSGWI